MIIQGRVWKYGDNINTDVIYPGKYTYIRHSPEEMSKHALEILDPEFSSNVAGGDIIVAGKNFGCGSSREQAAQCLKYAGVSAIIAKSFARIFFRNAVNNGLLVIESEEASESLVKKEEISIDTEEGIINAGSRIFKFNPLPDFFSEIIKCGGIVQYTKNRLKLERTK
ncbi:3-isopropylmalate dehydratase [candidate division KSB1 bacterium]